MMMMIIIIIIIIIICIVSAEVEICRCWWRQRCTNSGKEISF